MNWRKYPAFRYLIAYVTGLLTIFVSPWYAFTLFIALILFSERSWKGIFTTCLVAFLGGLTAHITTDNSNCNSKINTIQPPQEIRINQIKRTNKHTQIIGSLLPEKQLMCLIKVASSITLNPFVGDTIVLNTELQKPNSLKNPRSFDYAQYLNRKNIFLTAYVKHKEELDIKSSNSITLLSLAEKAQLYLAKTLDRHLPAGPNTQISKAIFLGKKGQIPEYNRTTFSRTGSMHVMAVSGLHVGILMWILSSISHVMFSSRRLKWVKLLFILIGLWSYALITGAQPSVVRSSLMFSLIATGIQLNRFYNLYNILYFSAFINFIINPMNLFDIGFQFSHIAVLSILFFFTPLREMIPDLEGWKSKLWDLVCVSVSVQILLMPLSAYYFHQIPIVFIPSNLIVIPLATITLVLCLTIVSIDPISSSLADAIGQLQHGFMGIANNLLQELSSFSWACIEHIWIHNVVLLLIFISSFLLIHWLYIGRRQSLLFAGLFWLSASTVHAEITNIKHKSNGMYIYHSRPTSTIDVIWNGLCLDLSPNPKRYSETDWARASNRSYQTNQETVILSETDSAAIGPLYLSSRIIKINNLCILMKKKSNITADSRKEIWVVQDDADWEGEVMDSSCPDQIIIGSGPQVDHDRWKALAEAYDIAIHDVDIDGFKFIPL